MMNNFIDENWNITHWDKRQYLESDSAKRVREHRERKRNRNVTEPLQERYSNVTETLPVVTETLTPPCTRAPSDSESRTQIEDIIATPPNREPLASGHAHHAHANAHANGYPREGEPGYRPGGEAQAILDAKKARLRGEA